MPAAPTSDRPDPDAPTAGDGPGTTDDPASSAVAEVVEVVDELRAGPPPDWSRRVTSRLDGFDDAVDGAFDRHLRGRPVVDRVMYSITELADFSLLWHLLATARALTGDDEVLPSVRVATVLGAESTVVNGVVKSLFRRQRPIPEFERPHHLRIPKTTSFPSGHASAAMCAATLLADGRGKARATGWYALAALVASSRVHVKIHHGSDVVGGAVLGLVIGRVARRAWPIRPR